MHEFCEELCAPHDQSNVGYFLDTYQELLFVPEYRQPARLHFTALVHCALNSHVPAMYFPAALERLCCAFSVRHTHRVYVSNQATHNYLPVQYIYPR